MRSSIGFVLILGLFTVTLSQKSQKPNVDCEAMKQQTGKKYHEIYVPHESDCNRFYQCTDHGLVELKCNRGLNFFPYIEGCVEKAADNCIINSQWRGLNA